MEQVTLFVPPPLLQPREQVRMNMSPPLPPPLDPPPQEAKATRRAVAARGPPRPRSFMGSRRWEWLKRVGFVFRTVPKGAPGRTEGGSGGSGPAAEKGRA
jgi:hypothetical protein